MSRKIALLLIMFILVNMVVDASDDPNTEGIIWLVIGIAAIIGFTILLVTNVAEADAPDDGIRLVSMQNVPLEQKGSSGSFLNVLQHVNVGYTPENNKAFIGFRYQY
jgi:glycerol uptake facilitator-like aquaporin